VLIVRGDRPALPRPGRVDLLSLVAESAMLTADEQRRFDAVFATGSPWAAEVADRARVTLERLDMGQPLAGPGAEHDPRLARLLEVAAQLRKEGTA